MKAFVVLLFVAFLGVLALTLRERLPLPYTLACLLLIGLNPVLWQFKNRLLSEIPFLLFAYLTLFLLQRAYTVQGRGGRAWAWALAAGLTAYLAFGTRTVGIVLLATPPAYELLTRRRLSMVSALFGGVFLTAVVVEKILLPVDGSYLDQLVFDPALFVRVAVSLAKAMGAFFDNGYSGALRGAVYLSLLALAGTGVLLRLRRGLTVYEPFAAFSYVLLVFWPCAEWNPRFLIPLLPLFLMYACEGLCGLAATRFGGCVRVAGAAAAVALVASYAACATQARTYSPCQEITAPPATALFEFIRTHTAPDDVLVFQQPRACALYTGRHVSAHHVPGSDEQFWHYLRHIRATHLVLCAEYTDSQAVLRPFVRRNAASVERVYDHAGFTVYRLCERDGGEQRLSRAAPAR
jgi:hypothetical protein